MRESSRPLLRMNVYHLSKLELTIEVACTPVPRWRPALRSCPHLLEERVAVETLVEVADELLLCGGLGRGVNDLALVGDGDLGVESVVGGGAVVNLKQVGKAAGLAV